MESKINQTIDHTLLKADAKYEDIEKVINEAKTHSFKSVCVQPTHVKRAARLLEGSSVKVCTVIGFPLGANTETVKVAEAKDAIQNGATEIDMVLNIGALKSKDQQLVANEIAAVRAVCTGGVILKVIIETALLTKEEKIIACELVTKAGADFIKTSTGFASSGASLDDIALFKQHIGPNVQIKASGGIRNKQQALDFIRAGASRLGTSNGVAIVSDDKSQTAAY